MGRAHAFIHTFSTNHRPPHLNENSASVTVAKDVEDILKICIFLYEVV